MPMFNFHVHGYYAILGMEIGKSKFLVMEQSWNHQLGPGC